MKNYTKANEIFDLNRFWKYFVVDIQNCINRYGLTIFLLCVMLPIAFMIGTLIRILTQSDPVGFALPFRLMVAGIASVIMFLSSPSICYGHITDKKMGTRFLMTPASTFEKYLSMLIICCIILPLTFMIGTFISDSIVCLIDPRSGISFAEGIVRIDEMRDELLLALQSPHVVLNGIEPASIAKLTNPFMYIDDFMSGTLVFLLGALWFKQRKVAKTIASLVLLSIVFSLIIAPFVPMLSDWESSEKYITGLLRHPVLWDTVSDTVVNLILAGLIYLRLKKISH